MISIERVSDKQEREILRRQEGHFIDFKAKEIRPRKLTRALSAFANADGGELFVGIEEKEDGLHWNGFSSQEAANGHIQAIEEFFPLGQGVACNFLTLDKKHDNLVLQVLVHKARDVKKASNGTPYLRRGAQNIPITTPEALRRLELDKGLATFETHTVSCPIDEITNSIVIIDFILGVIPSAEPAPWLKKQRLVVEGKPTVAGLLLFAEEPQAILPKRCGIKIYRYKTRDTQGTRDTLAFDPITVEGHLYKQIQDAVQKTADYVEELQILGSSGLEKVRYPSETLHEILTNAVIHRDYSITDDVHVRIFDNRIEVESPGRLPGHITEENILEERFARNGQIVRLLNKFPNPPNKDVGEGLRTAFEAMRKMKLKDPVIQQSHHSVVVNIRHEPIASPEVMIMEYLDNNPEISNRVARELCHIGSENKVSHIFRRMMDKGMIVKIPGRPRAKTAYRKPSTTGQVENSVQLELPEPAIADD